MNNTNITSKFESNLDIYGNRHVAMAARLDDQAQSRLSTAKRERNLAHTVLIIVAIVLGIAAANALKPFVGGLLLIALVIGFVIHTCLGGGVEAMILGRNTGNGMATLFGAIATVAAVVLLIGIAMARAIQMVEGGKSPVVAYSLSFAISLFEVGLPALVGYFSAQKAEKARHAHDDVVFFKELHGHVVTAPEDARGLFQDSQEELRDQIQQARAESTGTGHERRHIARVEDRLRLLKKADPGNRYKRGEEPNRISDAEQEPILNGRLPNSRV